MQTFLPYTSFCLSLKCLDTKRLEKQRLEAKLILEILEGKESRWKNHPATKMWKGYESALELYKNCAIAEWVTRGHKNSIFYTYNHYPKNGVVQTPHWLTEKFCAAHRSNLLRKNYTFYSQYGWKEPTDLPYIWPKGKSERLILKTLPTTPMTKEELLFQCKLVSNASCWEVNEEEEIEIFRKDKIFPQRTLT